MLNTEEDTFSISKKVQKMVDAYIDDKIKSEMKNYEEYKKVYDHILKLPMISQNMENSGSKVNTYMTKKIVDLTKEVSRLNKELELLKQKLSLYENTEQNQNIRLEIKEPIENKTLCIDNNLSSSNIYNELINTEENIVKNSNYSPLSIQDEEIKIDSSVIPEPNHDIKSIEFVTFPEEEPTLVGDISPRCWSLHNSYNDLKEEDDEKSNHTDLESETHENNEQDEEEEEVEEMEIEGSIYYVTNKVDGIIYEMLPEEDVGDKLGEIKGGKAFFY